MKRRDFIKLSAGLGRPPRCSRSRSRARRQNRFSRHPTSSPPAIRPWRRPKTWARSSRPPPTAGSRCRCFRRCNWAARRRPSSRPRSAPSRWCASASERMGPIVDDINVVNMPFLFKNTAHAQKMMDGPIGQELLDKITASPNAGLVALCWMDSGARSLYNTKRPIKTDRGPQGPEIPRDRQSDLRRHDERARRQRRRDGL